MMESILPPHFGPSLYRDRQTQRKLSEILLRAYLAQTQSEEAPTREESVANLYAAIKEAKGQTITKDVLRQIAACREAGHDPATEGTRGQQPATGQRIEFRTSSSRALIADSSPLI